MSAPNRAALLTKTFRVLKKHVKGAPPPPQETVLGKLLFACCLENAHHAAAAKALQSVLDSFFDLNEVRVSSVRELIELMPSLPDPVAAATRLKKVLQNVFETHYCFDLEPLKKINLGMADKKLRELKGVTPFGIAYVTQMALGGHAIALDRGTLGVLRVLGAIGPAEAEAGTVPGLCRAISKSQGPEFFYLIHEVGADAYANPHSNELKQLLMSISHDVAARWPLVFPSEDHGKASLVSTNGQEESTPTAPPPGREPPESSAHAAHLPKVKGHGPAAARPPAAKLPHVKGPSVKKPPEKRASRPAAVSRKRGKQSARPTKRIVKKKPK